MDIYKIILLCTAGIVCLIHQTRATLPSDVNCGVPQAPLLKRIVGGQVSHPFNWPWMVQLKANGRLQCGGTLVRSSNGSHVILTAAHCVDGSLVDPALWEVSMGFYSRESAIYDLYYQSFKVKRIIIHENFSPMTLQNDIAVLILDGTVNETIAVFPACVTGQKAAAGEPCVTMGYGQTNQDNPDSDSDRLKEIYKTIQPTTTCIGAYNKDQNHFDEVTMLCAGTDKENTGPCFRDSGGPLLCGRNGKWFLTGITSWAFPCAHIPEPAVYTNVFEYVVSGWLSDKAGI